MIIFLTLQSWWIMNIDQYEEIVVLDSAAVGKLGIKHA